MNAYHLPYSSLFIGCIILICVRFFLIVCLNYQQGVTRCCLSYRQMRRGYKSKFTDKSKANLIWIHLELAKVHRLKGLTSPYIVSYLCFLNINNILTLPQTFVVAEAGFDQTRPVFTLFSACQMYTHARQFTKSKQMQAVYNT